MNTVSWTRPVSSVEAAKRAGGRRGYNARRALMATMRRHQVAQLLKTYGFRPGVQARIARELGVDQATICRDIKQISFIKPCPTCGR